MVTLNHFPGQPIPTLYNSFSEEIFPNIKSKPPLMQLEAISSRPIAGSLGEETNTCLTATFFHVVAESEKVSPQPPLLQTNQSQFLQLLLIRLVLQTLHQPRCSSLERESQNHRMVGVGRDLCGSSSPEKRYLRTRSIKAAWIISVISDFSHFILELE